MKLSFYPRLAWEGIRKNKRLYLPYLLTCMGMVAIHYIILFLSEMPALDRMPGSGTVGSALGMSGRIIALFAVFFLFYSHSFLMRYRKKEFGLYNILGMGKGNISKLLFWETCIITVVSLGIGLVLGVVLSKLFELGLVNMMAGQIDYEWTVFPDTMAVTAMIFTGIFLLLFFHSLCQISFSHPIELLRSENRGEKPPKANWLIGLAGVILLIIAYSIALTVESLVTAITLFFVAVALVMVATYLLFGAGSVMLCRLLQKNKRYYYQPNHFVSVSSMVYRMNRNGAGLASICILLTMVLVMLSSTASLYIGLEDVILTRCPKDINIELQMQDIKYLDNEILDRFRDRVSRILDENQVQMEAVIEYQVGNTDGILLNGSFSQDEEAMQNFNFNTASTAVLLYLVPLADYNRVMDENMTLKEGEVLIYPFCTEYTASTFQMNGGRIYQVKDVVEDWIDNRNSAMTIIPTIFVFVEDLEAFTAPDRGQNNSQEDTELRFEWIYAFDLDTSAQEQMNICHQLEQTDWMRGLEDSTIIYAGEVDGQEDERIEFYYMFGGLFYIGILLSIVFLAATVLIIYYKQIAEGYEDQKRFELMQKVGMSRRDIRRSIHSQMLTIFFLPLLMSGIHLCFAFPVIRKILLVFNLQSTGLLIATTVGCFFVFGILYTLVYKLTANVYVSIVSGVEGQ
ncbi:MAG: ABC transporter permease [Lachnospiraceae bacterium]|nr:ABC transporter permease [Lachnospiraceae bacterium]